MSIISRIDLATSVLVGEERDIPLNRLKASPRNARRVAHSQADIESRAASIQTKGLLQALVVEPETRADGSETGSFLVTIGEGRRQALRLLAKRKVITKTTPIRCRVDLINDPFEISLDENVSRRDLHPADQYEAFKDLAERRGWGAEEIGARFGVSPQVVRQRLRLGAVAPALLDLYREDGLTLDQLMAFAVNPDPERQMQVHAQLTHTRQPYAIRRAMTEAKVAADDRRAVFVGLATAVRERANILVVGPTSSGKTTLVNALLAQVAALGERVVLAEDLRELQCAAPNLVAMRTRDGVASLRDLVRSALRLRPDRIIIGEVRGAEALELIKAWGTGHPGGVGTLHAGSAVGALLRLEQLIQEAVVSVPRPLIAETIDLIAVLDGRGRQRRLVELARVSGLTPDGAYQLTPA